MSKYNTEKLHIDYKIPEELEWAIDAYIEYLRTTENLLAEDCYQMEIQVELNACRRERTLTEKQIFELKQYYIRGGIHEIERGE